MLFMLNHAKFIVDLITNNMKSFILRTMLLLMVLFSITSCELVGDIFQAGVGVGIFLVILVVVLIIWLMRKFRR